MMDIRILLKEDFQYRQHARLENFTDHNKLNEAIVDNLLEVYYYQTPDFKRRVLACFNAAYHICASMLHEGHPEWSWPMYCDMAYCEQKNNRVSQATTLAMVGIYMQYFPDDWLREHKKLVDKLDNFLDINYIQFGDPFLNDYSYKDHFVQMRQNIPSDFIMPDDEFLPREEQRVNGPDDQETDEGEIGRLRKEVKALMAVIDADEPGGKGLTSKQAAVLTITICHHLGGLPSNRENLYPIVCGLCGAGEALAKRRLREGVKKKDADELAKMFSATSPKIARLIREMPEELKKDK